MCLQHWCNRAVAYDSRLTHMEFKPQFDDLPEAATIDAEKLQSDCDSDDVGPPKPEHARGRGLAGRGGRGRGMRPAL